MEKVPPLTPVASAEAGPLQPTFGDWVGCLWSAGSCWFMTGLFVIAWWWPLQLEHGAWVKLGVGVMVLEFIAVHSGGFMNNFFSTKLNASRLLTLLGLVGFYSLFGLAIALAFKSWWLLGSFVLLMAGRIHSGLVAQDAMSQAINQRRMIASLLLYLLLTFATVFVPFPAAASPRKSAVKRGPAAGAASGSATPSAPWPWARSIFSCWAGWKHGHLENSAP